MMSLDVAIAKGYATEQVADKLAANGLVSGILNVGGNVRAIGTISRQENRGAWEYKIPTARVRRLYSIW